MKHSTITMKDIALALNVSVATVSRALKDSYMISPETKQKILEYAEAHHFRPNLSAQFLKNKQTRSIGVSISLLNNIFYSDVMNGIESVAAEKDYHIIISQCHESAEKEKRNLEHFQWRGVDGLIASLSSETKDMEIFNELSEHGVPIVFFDRVPTDMEANKVVSDNVGGSYQLTKEILEKGYRKIAQITSQQGLSITVERLEGYQKALEEFEIPFRAEFIRHCPEGGKSIEEIEEAIDALLALPNPPEVIFTAADRITIATFTLLHRKGLRIPEDIAIAGFSNFEFAELFNPALTTVSQQAFKIGETAMKMLIDQIERKHGSASFESVVIPTVVNLRSST